MSDDKAPDAKELLDTAEPVDLDEIYLSPEEYPQPPEEWGQDVDNGPGVLTFVRRIRDYFQDRYLGEEVV